jgi:glutathione S-transferase
MIVYGSPLSPFVRKVLVYCHERGIAVETVFGRPGQPNPAFEATSPFGKIPGFRDGDFTISDSSAIIAYLEAKFPEGRLIPVDPAGAARATWYDEFADTIAFPPGAKVFFNRVVAPLVGRPQDLAAADAALADEMPKIYAYLESVIDGPYLVGDTLTLADISVASFLVNMDLCDGRADSTAYPKLCAWMSAIHARPSFAHWRAIGDKILG